MVARLVPQHQQQQQLPEDSRVGGERGRKSSSSSSSSRERTSSRLDCSSARLDADECCLQLNVKAHGRPVMLTAAAAAAAADASADAVAVCATTMASGEIKPESDRSLLSSTSFSSLSSSNHRLLYDSDDSSILAISSTVSSASRAPTPSRRREDGAVTTAPRSSSLATDTPNETDLSSSCLSQPAATTKQPSRRSLVRRRDQRRASLAVLQCGDSEENAHSLNDNEDATSIMAISGSTTEASKSLPRRQRRPSSMDIVAAATATPATPLSTDSEQTLPVKSSPRSCLRTTSSTDSKNRKSRSHSKRQLCRSVSFVPNDMAKHGVLETILGSNDTSPAQQPPLTEEERIAAWYNGRNYKLFRSTQHNETMEARNDAPENVAYRHDFALVWNTCCGRVDKKHADTNNDNDTATAQRAALSTAVRHLSQSRLRGLERTIFASTLSKHRTATVRAIVAAHCAETAQSLPQTTDSKKPHSSKFSVAHRVRMISLQHTQPFRRLARLMAQGDAKVVSTWHQRDKHKTMQRSLPEQPYQQPVPAELPQDPSLNVTAHSHVEVTETRARPASSKTVKPGKRRNLLLNYSDHSSSSSSRRRTKTSSTRRLSVSAVDSGSSGAKSTDLGASLSTTSTSSSSTATWHSCHGNSLSNSCLSGNLLDQGEHASCRHLLLQRQQQQKQQQQQHVTAVAPNIDSAASTSTQTVPTAPAAA